MWGSVSNRSCRLFIAFFILTLTFSLISAGVLKVNTTVSMAAYAKKSKKPSEENSNDEGGGGSNHKSGDGSHSKDKNKNNDQGTNNDQDEEPSSSDGGNIATDDNLQHIAPPKTGEGQ
jgi:hypothetical protein